MDFFENIEKAREDFPKMSTIKKETKKIRLNFYQIFSICVFIACFFLGILLGNIFSTCQASSYFYSNVCVVKEFNFFLMITVWFISLFVCIFFFAIGHIIYYLKEIHKKLDKI